MWHLSEQQIVVVANPNSHNLEQLAEDERFGDRDQKIFDFLHRWSPILRWNKKLHQLCGVFYLEEVPTV